MLRILRVQSAGGNALEQSDSQSLKELRSAACVQFMGWDSFSITDDGLAIILRSHTHC